MAEGYKAWSGGQVLQAEDLTDYASSQAVMRFANAAGRDASLTVSVVKEGMLAYLKDTNIITVNTNGLTTGWAQIYPVITSGITDSQITNAKLAADSVSSTNIIAGTIVGGDIAAATITGSNIAGSTITGSNIASGTITGGNIQDGSIGPADLAGGTYGISISGNAATATSATSAGSASTAGYATSAGNADTLDNFNSDQGAGGNTVAVRNSGGSLQSFSYTASGGSTASFYDLGGAYTYLGLGCLRVLNADFVFSTPISGGRTVLVNSNQTLGTSTSSIRFKEDIKPLPYEVGDILKLAPILFRYRADHVEADSDRPLEVGLIAENLADLGFEEIIYRGKDGKPDGIAYEKLAVLVLKVCQDQQTQLDALSARLDKIGA
jgi:hypothetical protein